MRYYFYEMIKFEDFSFSNISLDKKSNKIFWFVTCRTNALLDIVDWFVRDYDGNKHLVSIGVEKYYAVYDRIIHRIGLKRSITYVSYDYPNIKIDSDEICL